MAKKNQAAAAKAAQKVTVNVLEYTNEIALTGRVVSADEKTFDSGKKVTTLKIAHNFGKGKDDKKRAIFPRVIVFGDITEDLLKKGAPILVKGYLAQNNFERDGKKYFGQVINANSVEAAPMNGKRIDSQNSFVITGRLPKDAYISDEDKAAKFTVLHNGNKERDERNGVLALDVTAFSRHNKKDTPLPKELLTKGTAVKVKGYLAPKAVIDTETGEELPYFNVAYNALSIEATPVTGTKEVEKAA